MNRTYPKRKILSLKTALDFHKFGAIMVVTLGRCFIINSISGWSRKAMEVTRNDAPAL
ncbi:hypothetical protein CEAn_00543 [Coxiella endosymbiont of Amblyomma nuttalli]|nr:hypothetical protein CEAn_00543 [Coxiella endosymbiont of Amblyomma nuttalli]